MCEAKAARRRELRARRQTVADRSGASAAIVDRLQSITQVRDARTVAAFTSRPSEPDTSALIAWCEGRGQRVVLPEDEPPPDPATIDVVIVPGLGFTADGRRLGQGGGWYDRFLPQLGPGSVTVGVAFETQIVTSLPLEPHDVPVDCVVTEVATRWAP